jgi:hypothetical protein
LLELLIVHEKQVAESLKSLQAKRKVVESDGKYGLPPGEREARVRAATVTAAATPPTAVPTAPGLDLRSAILAALCMDPKVPIPSADVRGRIKILTGLDFDEFDVLNRLVRLAQQGTIKQDGVLFSRDCP